MGNEYDGEGEMNPEDDPCYMYGIDLQFDYETGYYLDRCYGGYYDGNGYPVDPSYGGGGYDDYDYTQDYYSDPYLDD